MPDLTFESSNVNSIILFLLVLQQHADMIHKLCRSEVACDNCNSRCPQSAVVLNVNVFVHITIHLIVWSQLDFRYVYR